MEPNCEAAYDFTTDYDSMGGVDEMEGESVPGIEGEDENFDMVELEILTCWRREQTQARKKEKHAVLGEICREFGNLEKHCNMQPIKWQEKWELSPIANNSMAQKAPQNMEAMGHPLVWVQVLCKHVHIKEEDGTEPHTPWIDLYQRALTAFMQDDLTEEQLQAAQHIADKWNGAKGPMPEVKAW
ncbi:hypothetical protein EDC04DRAFT_2600202 [Pisolithus marmoratus]|nr:hypothetical protein EDC04DRAFT_2600202 [Pisolithus marmoratus]